MLQRFRKTWEMLGKEILIGERYERNLKSIRDLAFVMMLAGTVMFIMNILSREYLVSLTSAAIIIAGFFIYRFVAKRNRKGAMILTIIAVVLVFTYDIFFVNNGFAYLWTMLIPLAVCYLFSVRAGIIISLYFWLLFVLAFYTPLKLLLVYNYDPVIMIRFPILYLFHIIFTSFVMVQYHKNTLYQIEHENNLKAAGKTAEEALKAAETARESAEQANAAKSNFLADMSHEIRTPINAVLGMNEMILRESLHAKESGKMVDPDNIIPYAGNIESAGGNLLSIINDILDFSKIEAGQMQLAEADYKLSSMLNDVSSMILFRAKDKGLRFSVDVDETIPDGLYGDKVRLRQVVTNILNNAVKYTNEGGIMLSVRAEPEESFTAGQKLYLIITVQDTGIGIRQEDIEKLFTKFQRVNMEHNSTIEGTGLGLAITYNLLQLMGGSIRVESSYGKGSAFTVKIPQQISSCEPIGHFQTRFERNMLAARPDEESFRAPQARILIVDDTSMNLTVAAGLLKSTEIAIDTADSGAKAIALAKQIHYDLILMDQRMPEMDGTEALHHIREAECAINHDTPVICLTADAVIGAKERYIAGGFTDYLAKPIDSSALNRILMKYLPQEKVFFVMEEEHSSEREEVPAQSGLNYAVLQNAGINPDTGLKYCQNDESFYHMILQEYVQSASQKLSVLQRCFEEENWTDYAIHVHALKAASATIGAAGLSELAAGMEKACNQADLKTIRLGHPGLLKQYNAIIDTLTAQIDTEAVCDDDDEVLEFLPEE